MNRWVFTEERCWWEMDVATRRRNVLQLNLNITVFLLWRHIKDCKKIDMKSCGATSSITIIVLVVHIIFLAVMTSFFKFISFVKFIHPALYWSLCENRFDWNTLIHFKCSHFWCLLTISFFKNYFKSWFITNIGSIMACDCHDLVHSRGRPLFFWMKVDNTLQTWLKRLASTLAYKC